MSGVKWIKLSIDTFNDEKIRLIESMPEGDALIVIWCKLLCLAGKINDGGFIYMGQNIPYTDEMLSTIFNRPVNTVRLALKTFEGFQMISNDQHGICLLNWSDHQNVEGLERVRELNRLRQERFRKSAASANPELPSDVTLHNVTVTLLDREEDKELDKEEDIEEDKNTNRYSAPPLSIPYQEIIDAYNKKLGTLMPSVRLLTETRRKAIRARWNEHPGFEEFVSLFNKAAATPFLVGENNRNWVANFDWLMNSQNWAKVIEGRYDGSPNAITQNETQAQRNDRILREMLDKEQRKEVNADGFRTQGYNTAYRLD